MGFQKGIEKVNESAQRSGFTGGERRFFNWESGETKVIRFLTEGDEIVLTKLHEYIPCEDGKKRSFVCRREVDEVCELCSNPDTAKTRELAFAAAVWRVEKKKEDGTTTFATKTQTVEREEDGKIVSKVEPWVGIMRQAPKNFWGWFYEAYDKSGTLLDRDFSITRRGKDKQTTYQPYPEDKQELDLSKFDAFKPDLEEFLTWQASKEYYDKFLHGVEKSKGDESSNSNGVSQLTADDIAEIEAANEEVAAAASGDFD